MRTLVIVFSLLLTIISCKPKPFVDAALPDPNVWSVRKAVMPADSLLVSGKTYLSVHSRVYSEKTDRVHNVNVTVSLRNSSASDSIYLYSAEYFDTHGKMIRNYFSHPIFLIPMETVEIIIEEEDIEGGTGGNFIFNWAREEHVSRPLFEAVMISTAGSQGISFTAQGIDL